MQEALMAALTATLLPPRTRRARPGIAQRAHRGRSIHQDHGPGAHDHPRSFTRLIDAKAAGELLDVPYTWLLAQARAGRIPHHRLGHYVRFNPDDLKQWLHETRSGVGSGARWHA
jgi:excisionase family DNA binding protein